MVLFQDRINVIAVVGRVSRGEKGICERYELAPHVSVV